MPLALPPLALYVHFPWCVRKCPYCDFNSYTLRDRLPEERYVEALLRDIESQVESHAGPLRGRPPLVSVFLGGGTPSLFSPAAIGRVLDAARSAFGLAADAEITMEANPGAIERGRFGEYRAAGVNRVSLGAQSFDAAKLAVLGRIHSPGETSLAAQELHAAGLANFNLDLMYALPGQDSRGAVSDVERAIALAPAHLSHYQLTLEAGTIFAAAPPAALPSDEASADMLAACEERIAAAGFGQYEVSAYAKPGRASRHNSNYWTFGDYVGIGAGAHGKLSDSAGGHIIRTAQTREPRRYMASPAGSLASTLIGPEDLPFEFMLNALRLTRGFERQLFESRTGLDWRCVAPIVEELENRGLMSREGERWAATALGARFLNDVLVRFIPRNRAPAAQPPVGRSGLAAGPSTPPATGSGTLSTA